MPPVRLTLAAGSVLLATALLPATAGAAPTISGGNGDVWNAQEVPATYTITGTRPGASLAWQLRDDDGPVTGFAGGGASPLTVTLPDAPEGQLTIVAAQLLPGDPGRSARSFRIDTRPPVITISRPVADATYEQGEEVVADFACRGAQACTGTVDDGDPIDTSALGPAAFTVAARDAAGNTARARVEYDVVAAPAPPAPPSPPPAAPSGSPAPPSPPIRLAPPPAGGSPDQTVPAVENARRLLPPAGAAVNTRRPLLRWTRVGAARLYNLQVFRLRGDDATKVLSAFPRGNRFRVPRGRLAFGERYVWRVWPLIDGSYPAEAHGLSFFDVRRPIRLTGRQLLINQRISQAALRRTAAVDAWLDAGIVTGDLRDGGLAAADFGGDVSLAGLGDPIANGFADPRPVPTGAPARSGSPRLRVSARQLLINQRISQAAVRRANALERRIAGNLTGGDLREGAVSAVKLAPGLRIASAQPAGPAPAASRTVVAAGSRSGGAVRLTDRQVLINQRISQAAVRRANALIATIEGGLAGTNFADGAITAVGVAPELR